MRSHSFFKGLLDCFGHITQGLELEGRDNGVHEPNGGICTVYVGG